MAINTDAAFEKSPLGEREVSNPTDFQDTEKLLSGRTTEPTGESNLKESDSFSLNIRSSVRSLDADQNGHRSPLKSGSVGQLATPPKSSSRMSLGPLPSPVPPGSEPPSYLWLAVLACFCPAPPLNVYALWYASVVSIQNAQGWFWYWWRDSLFYAILKHQRFNYEPYCCPHLICLLVWVSQ